MAVTIIFGGQYGSEGKGKTAHFFAVKENAKYCVRVGGPNSGHTVYRNNKPLIFRILPTAAIERDTVSILAAGSYIDLSILQEEIDVSGISPDRLLIDPNAVVINEDMKSDELHSNLRARIGSTLSGTGQAVIDRIKREGDSILANNCPELKKYICDTKEIMRTACDNNEKIIIEGTQGFGLSLIHSEDYPYVTSRDTSAAGFLSETGLSPFDVENIVMVIRTFPIRVSGNSGPLPKETDWDTIKTELGSTDDMTEYTSCTKRIRRVARFDADIVKKSIRCNKPNIIVLNHLDYIQEAERQSTVSQIEDLISANIDYIGYNPVTLEKKEKLLSEVS